MRRQRRQRFARREREAGADVDRNRELIVAEQLDLMPAIERQRALAERAEKSHVTAITELRHTDRGVARIVRREVEQRTDTRIRLSVVVTIEPFETPGQ